MFEHLKQALKDKFDNSTPASNLHLDGPLVPVDSHPAPISLRDTLFADTPLIPLVAHLTPDALVSGPFAIFAQASRAPRPEAIAALQPLTSDPESRIQLLAWNALARLGVHPPPELAKQVLGVVTEVGVNGGIDYVAAYADHRARYFNFSGAAIIWETDDPRLNPQIDSLLEAGRVVAERIGPWEKDRPEPPTEGLIRLNVLTPSGLHFGQGPLARMAQDMLGGHVVQASLALMQALMEIDKQARK